MSSKSITPKLLVFLAQYGNVLRNAKDITANTNHGKKQKDRDDKRLLISDFIASL